MTICNLFICMLVLAGCQKRPNQPQTALPNDPRSVSLIGRWESNGMYAYQINAIPTGGAAISSGPYEYWNETFERIRFEGAALKFDSVMHRKNPASKDLPEVERYEVTLIPTTQPNILDYEVIVPNRPAVTGTFERGRRHLKE